MSENICIPKTYFIIIFAIFSIFTYFHTVKMTNYMALQEEKKKHELQEETKYIKQAQKLAQKQEQIQEQIQEQLKIQEKSNESNIDALLKRDTDAVENKFKPPERRLPRHSYPKESLKRLINLPTRGYPDNYHNIGMLVRKNDEKILKLFGRQKYPGSNQWEYYIIGSDGSHSITKIPLKIPGNKELSNNDVIAVPWLDQSKGKFNIKIFDYDAPRYRPDLL